MDNYTYWGFRSAYSASLRVPAPSGGVTRTQQSFKDECDINVIMARYLATGVLPESINEAERQYLDTSGYDFQEAMQIVAGAASLFEQLPSKIRNRVDNDPGKLLGFLQDPKNRKEAEELGLLRVGANLPPTPLQTAALAAAASAAAPADPAPSQANPPKAA